MSSRDGLIRRTQPYEWSGLALAAGLVLAVSTVSALTIAGLAKQHVRNAPVPAFKGGGNTRADCSR